MKKIIYCLTALIGLAMMTSSCSDDDEIKEESSITIVEDDIIGNWEVTSASSEADIAEGASMNFIDGGILYISDLGEGTWNIQNDNEIVLDFSDANDLTLTVTNVDGESMTLTDESGIEYSINRSDITVSSTDIAGYWTVSSVSGTSSYGITEGVLINLLSTGSYIMSGYGYGTWEVDGEDVQMVISGTTITLTVVWISDDGSTIRLTDESGVLYKIEKRTLTVGNDDVEGAWELASLSGSSAYGLAEGSVITLSDDGTSTISGIGSGTWEIQNDNEIKLTIAGTDIIMTVGMVEDDGATVTFIDASGIIYVSEKTIVIAESDIKGNWAVTSVEGTSAYGITTSTLIEFADEGVLNLSGNMTGSGTWTIQNNNEVTLNIFSTDIVMTVNSIDDDGETITATDGTGVVYVIEKTIVLSDDDLIGNWSVNSVSGTSAYGITTSTLIEFANEGILNLSGNLVGTGTWAIQNNNEVALNIFSTDILMVVTAIDDDSTTITFYDPQGVTYVIVKSD